MRTDNEMIGQLSERHIDAESAPKNKHEHYFKDVSTLKTIDIYRLLELYDVTCPVAQHVIKKAFAAGKRGAKNKARDMHDIADSANRWLEMREEDNAKC